MRWNAISTAVPLALVSGLVAFEGEETQPSASAANVVERMSQTYRTVETYRDVGTVREVRAGPKGEIVSERRFVTAFVRPDRFRFEINNRNWPNHRYLIWREGKNVQGFWSLKGVRTFASLDEAVATGAGVTRRASHTVPALLVPEEIGGSHLTEMRNIEMLPNEVVDDLECYVLEGNSGTAPSSSG